VGGGCQGVARFLTRSGTRLVASYFNREYTFLVLLQLQGNFMANQKPAQPKPQPPKTPNYKKPDRIRFGDSV